MRIETMPVHGINGEVSNRVWRAVDHSFKNAGRSLATFRKRVFQDIVNDLQSNQMYVHGFYFRAYPEAEIMHDFESQEERLFLRARVTYLDRAGLTTNDEVQLFSSEV